MCRRNFTPTEAASLGRTIKAIEGPKAKARKEAGQKSGGRGKKKLGENFTPSSKPPRTRDLIGEVVGMSGITYERAEAVAIAEEMDRTGKVSAIVSWRLVLR